MMAWEGNIVETWALSNHNLSKLPGLRLIALGFAAIFFTFPPTRPEWSNYARASIVLLFLSSFLFGLFWFGTPCPQVCHGFLMKRAAINRPALGYPEKGCWGLLLQVVFFRKGSTESFTSPQGQWHEPSAKRPALGMSTPTLLALLGANPRHHF